MISKKNQIVLKRFTELLDEIEQDQDLINKVGCIISLVEGDEVINFVWNGQELKR